jgi:hypothetical protein
MNNRYTHKNTGRLAKVEERTVISISEFIIERIQRKKSIPTIPSKHSPATKLNADIAVIKSARAAPPRIAGIPPGKSSKLFILLFF